MGSDIRSNCCLLKHGRPDPSWRPKERRPPWGEGPQSGEKWGLEVGFFFLVGVIPAPPDIPAGDVVGMVAMTHPVAGNPNIAAGVNRCVADRAWQVNVDVTVVSVVAVAVTEVGPTMTDRKMEILFPARLGGSGGGEHEDRKGEGDDGEFGGEVFHDLVLR